MATILLVSAPAAVFAADTPSSAYSLKVTGGIASVVGPTEDVDSVKFVLDSQYLGEDDTAPFSWDLPSGGATLKARVYSGDAVTRLSAAVGATTSAGPIAPASAAPVPAATPARRLPNGTGSTVAVSTADELSAALGVARPGQTISMADGTYSGKFVISASGTSAQPITLVGSRAAVIDGGDTGKGYALHLDGASFWRLQGFSVKGAQKGVMTDKANSNLLSGLDVGNTGMEAVHFRNFSSNNTLEKSGIHDTGLEKPDYGEGVYIGSAKSNWTSNSGGQPDASNGNRIIGNSIARTTAESIDVKEATAGGLIQNNTLDGSAISGANFADSLIDMKGSNYRIIANTATGTSAAMVDVFQTHVITDGSGAGNTFSANKLDATLVTGYGINISKAANTITCDNTAGGAAAGVSNIQCSAGSTATSQV